MTPSQPYISIVEGDSTQIPSLNSGSTASITAKLNVLEGTPLGTYTIMTTVSYSDTHGTKYYQIFNIPVNVDSTSATRNTIITVKQMSITPEVVRPGDSFDFNMEILCSSADAYDIIAVLSLTPGSPFSPLSPTRVNLGDVKKEGFVDINYRLLSSGSVSAGQYPVTVMFSYTNSRGQPESLTETQTIIVEELIDFELLDTPSVEAKRGETRDLEADLLLIGTDSVQFVSVELVESPVFRRVSGSTEYIGAVDPDSPIPFNIKYRVADDASVGSYTMSVRVNYRDHLNREHHEDVGLGVTVVGAQSGGTETPQTSSLWMWVRRLFGLGP